MSDAMDAEAFRVHGKALIDWIADHWEGMEGRPIIPDVLPGDIRAMLPDAAPEDPEPFAEVLADLDRVVVPGLTGWQAPGWFAYFPAMASFPAILGELAAAGMAQQGMLWSTGPATTEVEAHVLDWLVDLMGVPQAWKTTAAGGGVLQMSASDSTHTALVVARAMAQAPAGEQVAYASAQAHSSIEKGARVAAYGHVRLVDVDPGTHAMSVEALRAAIAADRAAGLTPTFVCAAVGTTGTTAVDPVRAIAEVGRDHDMWVHVDAAYAGSAMICEELRHHQEGLELVDSYTFNPHKWLATNFDCSVFWVADRRPLIETLSILPPYLADEAGRAGAPIDYRDWHVPLGRRFRALKLWFVLRAYGASGLREMIRSHIAMARELAERIAAHPDLQLVAPTPFALVSFAHREGDEATRRIAEAVNAARWAHLGTSVIDDRVFIRVSIGSPTTEARHVDALWELIAAAS
ncbi:MAG TPA: pyridoxal-dependent decarboxylase [Euzebya sp.]|nr:pyridoxal-dependent decarboxylase [Euzebya sp.]